jgi:hypothetical protein
MNEAETPTEHIDPCGYAGLRVTQACELGITVSINELQAQLAQNLVHGLQQHFLMKTHPHPTPLDPPLSGGSQPPPLTRGGREGFREREEIVRLLRKHQQG